MSVALDQPKDETEQDYSKQGDREIGVSHRPFPARADIDVSSSCEEAI
jgi:hypothetical protein